MTTLLFLVIAGAAARVVHLYHVENAASAALHAESTKVPRVKWSKSYTVRIPFVLGKDGSLYVASLAGLFALDSSGTVQWVKKLDLDESIRGGLVQDEQGNIYFTSSREVYALTATGRKLWEVKCTPAVTAQVPQGATFDEQLLYTACGKYLYALDKRDGSERWRMPAVLGDSVPVMLDDKLVFLRGMKAMSANAKGETLWDQTTAGDSQVADFNTPIAVGADGNLYSGGQNFGFVSVEKGSSLKWRFKPEIPNGFMASPVISSDGTVIAVSTFGLGYALTPEGAVKWRFSLGPNMVRVVAAPVLGKDGVIYLFADGIYALSAQGTKIWKLSLPGLVVGDPTLAPDGTLYVATDQDLVYAVQTSSKGLMESAWPKYQHDVSNSGHAKTLAETAARAR